MSWNNITVGDLVESGEAEVKTGPFGTQLRASDYVEKGTPVINVRNIGFGSIRPDKLEYIPEEVVKRLSNHLLRKGDIVFGRKGAVERHVYIRSGQERWFQGSDCLRLRINSENSVLSKYLSFTFLTHEHQSWMMQQCSHGATMASLNQDIIKRISVRLPPIEKQRMIVDILSAYDDLIENNTRRIEILEEMARRLYEEWFVHFRFPGHEEVSFKESELGRIPEGWGIANLEEVVDLTMGQSPKSEFYNDRGEGLPFHQGVTDFGNYFPSNRLYCTVENRVAEEGDILFSVRAPVGRINISKEKIVIGRGVSALRSKAGHQVFLLSQLRKIFEEEDSIGNGAIFKAVTKKDMQTIKMLQPNVHYIESFESIAGPLWKQIRVLSDKNINLRGQRDLLLPKLVSGEIDVSDIPMPNDKEVEAA
ncbi:restriction endonuclease subunit S [Halomonas sp. GFAJ-1]|uniref:restriction endonuclease subunit S n=1 Tax=Halomonas sp. GFAJ-1 TaxID=1118153 RepID=UPI00023A337C|nr:restriction endonuclease subunit S [Halomonas sp. GFAJ-1]AVI63505.1 type I restriction endonuclease subunit S [Halomonas sp. GFAJ-1]EHK61491.1 restriction modification system DNA specificity domain-containing protein [Halomonas sp. GFAJ-1]